MCTRQRARILTAKVSSQQKTKQNVGLHAQGAGKCAAAKRTGGRYQFSDSPVTAAINDHSVAAPNSTIYRLTFCRADSCKAQLGPLLGPQAEMTVSPTELQPGGSRTEPLPICPGRAHAATMGPPGNPGGSPHTLITSAKSLCP